jgi:hypothetical protein
MLHASSWLLNEAKSFKFIFDKVIRIAQRGTVNHSAGAAQKEIQTCVNLWIKRKRPNNIECSSSALEIVNKPLAIYAIPYEQYSTLTTDNVLAR